MSALSCITVGTRELIQSPISDKDLPDIELTIRSLINSAISFIVAVEKRGYNKDKLEINGINNDLAKMNDIIRRLQK